MSSLVLLAVMFSILSDMEYLRTRFVSNCLIALIQWNWLLVVLVTYFPGTPDIRLQLSESL